MIIDNLIKDFEDKNTIVNKKRKDIFKQDCKETYSSRSKNKKKRKQGK